VSLQNVVSILFRTLTCYLGQLFIEYEGIFHDRYQQTYICHHIQLIKLRTAANETAVDQIILINLTYMTIKKKK